MKWAESRHNKAPLVLASYCKQIQCDILKGDAQNGNRAVSWVWFKEVIK